MHPDANKLAGYLDKTISRDERKKVETHLASCRECLNTVSAAHEAVTKFRRGEKTKDRRSLFMKKINPYLALAIAFFLFSFITPKFFLQSLVATLVFGIKWVADSRSAKMLVMIYDAWKMDGGEGASRILGAMEKDRTRGLDPAIKLKSKII